MTQIPSSPVMRTEPLSGREVHRLYREGQKRYGISKRAMREVFYKNYEVHVSPTPEHILQSFNEGIQKRSGLIYTLFRGFNRSVTWVAAAGTGASAVAAGALAVFLPQEPLLSSVGAIGGGNLALLAVNLYFRSSDNLPKLQRFKEDLFEKQLFREIWDFPEQSST